MKQITFENIHIIGDITTENALYKHYHYPEMIVRYDSNFIAFKSIPTITEFDEAEKYLRAFHLDKGQNHVKFTFPQDRKLETELTTYLTGKGYDIGFIELYAIQPRNFPPVQDNNDIEIRVVTDANLAELLQLQYKSDVAFGTEFANQKIDLIKRHFKNPSIQQVLAFYKGKPAGYVYLIITNQTVEIDNLSVDEAFQRKGIGSQLQKFAMDSFPDKTVILVADGEDTPREMYTKQNYTYCGFTYEIQKVYED